MKQHDQHRSVATHANATAPAGDVSATAPSAAGSTGTNATNASPADPLDEPDADTQVPGKPKMSIGAAIGALLFAGLASPFLELQDPFHGVIGLIILFVGIRIAWQLTAEKRLDILGPFSKSSPAKTDA